MNDGGSGCASGRSCTLTRLPVLPGGPVFLTGRLVFDLGQAAVYLFHNGPERKIFMDGRLEIPSRETFQTYVRLENILNEGRHGWAEPVGRMGDPLILLDHEKEFGAEATILSDPEWRCIYFDAVASVFLSRCRGLETSFPSVDFVMRHFHDPLWQAIPPVPWGLAEAKGTAQSGVGGSVSGQVNRATSSLPSGYWRATASGRRLPWIRPLPGTGPRWGSAAGTWSPTRWTHHLDQVYPWDIATGLLPAQATFCFRRALELDPARL